MYLSANAQRYAQLCFSFVQFTGVIVRCRVQLTMEALDDMVPCALATLYTTPKTLRVSVRRMVCCNPRYP